LPKKRCELCDAAFAVLRRRHHCRNCGAAVCDSCALARWPAWALPPLYVGAGRGGARGGLGSSSSSSSSALQRVCVGCNRAAFAFRAALAAGDAKACAQLHGSGNLNLRAPLPPLPPSSRGPELDRLRERPVHLAAMAGSLPLLKVYKPGWREGRG
jgi:hypothetical protein